MANTQAVDIPNQLPSFIKAIMAQVSQPDVTPDAYAGDAAPQTMPVTAAQMAGASGVQPQQQKPLAPVGDIAHSMVQDQTAPDLRNRMYTATAGGPVTETKGHKLLDILRGALSGAGAGAGQPTFGAGFQRAQTLPLQIQGMQLGNQRIGLENQQLAQSLPFLALGKLAELRKTQAETQKLQGEIEGMPIKQALEQAQARAAEWKTGPNGSLVNIRTGQTYKGETAILTPEEASALGNKQAGDVVPIDIKVKASEIVTRGHTNVSTSEGVFDYNRATGQKTRIGTPPAMAVINNNQLTDDPGLNMAADYYAQTGQLPSGFGRSPATTAAIIKRASDRHAGEDIAKNKLDYEATKKYMGTLNGNQQVRLRQAIGFASDSLDKLQGLYSEWQTLAPQSGFKILNRATLSAMKNAPGRAGAVANALEAQIADLTSELGNIYMGGNSPTDHSLSLAQKNLSADWNKETFDEAISQVRKNLYIRQNSITNAAPAGVSNNSLFQPQNTANNGGPTADDLLKKYPPKGK